MKSERLLLGVSLVPYVLGALGWFSSVLWRGAFHESPSSAFSPAQLLGVLGWYLGWLVSIGASLLAAFRFHRGWRSRAVLVAYGLAGAYAVIFGVWLFYSAQLRHL